jgi:hypothetical protein
LATNVAASAEEARTAAMAACRLIAKHKLLGLSAGEDDGAVRRPHDRGPRSEPEARRKHRTAPDDGPVSYRAGRPGTCAFCATAFGPEDDILSYPNGSTDHWHCAKRRAAGAEPGF